ncbi:hypothetical protein Trydic_g7383 [Trypoxylus dichotomus]
MSSAWNEMLEHLQASSATLQSSDQGTNTDYALYESLGGYVQVMRSTFSYIETKVKVLASCEEYQQTLRRRKRNTKCDYLSACTTFDETVDDQTPRQHFDIEVFIVTSDNILSALDKWMIKELAGIKHTDKCNILLARHGIIIAGTKGKFERWRKFIQELLEDRRQEAVEDECNSRTGSSITREQVQHAVKLAKNNKVPGPDEMSMELIKLIAEEEIEVLDDLHNT